MPPAPAVPATPATPAARLHMRANSQLVLPVLSHTAPPCPALARMPSLPLRCPPCLDFASTLPSPCLHLALAFQLDFQHAMALPAWRCHPAPARVASHPHHPACQRDTRYWGEPQPREQSGDPPAGLQSSACEQAVQGSETHALAVCAASVKPQPADCGCTTAAVTGLAARCKPSLLRPSPHPSGSFASPPHPSVSDHLTHPACRPTQNGSCWTRTFCPASSTASAAASRPTCARCGCEPSLTTGVGWHLPWR